MAKMRIWWQNNLTGMQHYNVSTEEEAAKKFNQLAELDLSNDQVTDNVGGCEYFEDGEWSEWYNNEGMDINEVASGDT